MTEADPWFAEWMRLTRTLLPRHMGPPPLDDGALQTAFGAALNEAGRLLASLEASPCGIGNEVTRETVGHLGFSSGEVVGFWLSTEGPEPFEPGSVLPFRRR